MTRLLRVLFFMIVPPVMLFGMIWVFGEMLEGIGNYNVEHDRCLKQAENGYEIKQCN